MQNKCLKANSLRGIKNGPEVATNELLALDNSDLALGGPTMPENTGKLQQNDSASNPEQSTFPRDAVGLTKRQRALLVFIGDYHRRFGVSPSFQEMMEHMGLRSKNGIHRLVHGLAKRGHVRLDKRAARSVVPKSVGPSLADAIDTLLSQAKLSSSTEAELRALLSAEVANG